MSHTSVAAELEPVVERPFVDHHCHGVLLRDVDRHGFESLLNEADGPSPLGTTFFESMAGLAVRRWCAPVLDLEPNAPADAYMARRGELGAHEVAQRMLHAATLSDLLVDTGLAADGLTTLDELALVSGARCHQIVRLESLVEDLLCGGTAAADVPSYVADGLSTTTAVGAKSIAAYRSGLALPATEPRHADVRRALSAMSPGSDGRYRVAHPDVSGWLAWAAIGARLPLQLHVGYGDSDIRLHECDPLLLTEFLRATRERAVPVLLLHNYPFHRQAAYLAQVFAHVFLDVGLAVHNTGALSTAVLREAMEVAPFGKLLYSSDGFGLPELHYLGSRLFRRALRIVLEGLVSDGEATLTDAERIVALVGAENARRVYRLG